MFTGETNAAVAVPLSVTHLDVIDLPVEQPATAPHACSETPNEREISFRHTGWAPTRRFIVNAMRRLRNVDEHLHTMAVCADRKPPPSRGVSKSRLAAFEECGETSWLMRGIKDPTKFKVSCSRCHDRFCVPCAAERASGIQRKIHEKMGRGVHRFVTLTLKHTDAPLHEQLGHLYQSFRRLRQRQAWKHAVKGGIAFCEIKWIERTRQWHPHLHILTHGKYLDKKLLADEWYAVTGTSWIIDIRIVSDAQTAAKYVSKYVTKGYDRSVMCTESVLVEAIQALHRRRCVIVIGDWKGFRMSEPPSDVGWEVVERLSELLHRAATGDATAREIVATMRRELTQDQLDLEYRANPPPLTTVAKVAETFDDFQQSMFPDGKPPVPMAWATHA